MYVNAIESNEQEKNRTRLISDFHNIRYAVNADEKSAKQYLKHFEIRKRNRRADNEARAAFLKQLQKGK